MAISKERLQELIDKGAFIFYIYNEKSIGIIRLDKSYGISVDEYNAINKCKPVFYRKGNVYQDICDADKIFETKEQAEWYINHHATRTEELDLPTWEEFDKKNKTICFIAKDWQCYELGFAFGDTGTICLDKMVLGVNTNQKTWKSTEENYTKACDLCLKLFKEEEV